MDEVVIPRAMIAVYIDAVADLIGAECAKAGEKRVADTVRCMLSNEFDELYSYFPQCVPAVTDSAFADHSIEGSGAVGRAGLRVGTHNMRLKPAALWLSSLLASDVFKNSSKMFVEHVAPETSPLFEPLISALGSFAELVTLACGVPSIADVMDSRTEVDEDDLSLFRLAVCLSCGNELGLCLRPKSITVDELLSSCGNPYLFEDGTFGTTDGCESEWGNSDPEKLEHSWRTLAPLEDVGESMTVPQSITRDRIESVMDRLSECGIFKRSTQEDANGCELAQYRYRI